MIEFNQFMVLIVQFKYKRFFSGFRFCFIRKYSPCNFKV